MRKIIAVLLFVTGLLASLSSCAKTPDADKMLLEFMEIYSAAGVIYTPTAEEGEDGYIEDELFRKIYIFEGAVPERFAILLNFHADSRAECGVFVCQSSEERERVTEMCRERIKLLGQGSESAFITVSGAVVFYSTMPDRARAEAIWQKIVRVNT